jgi:hypothetical protein
MTFDIDFYRWRMCYEHVAAVAAADPLVKMQHQTLAGLYEERLRAMSRREIRPIRRVSDNELA